MTKIRRIAAVGTSSRKLLPRAIICDEASGKIIFVGEKEMPKRPRVYYRPVHLETALQQLAQPDTVPLGGGTKLLAADVTVGVVDLQDLGLDQAEQAGDWLRVGAMVRLTDLAALVARHPLLAAAIHRAGPNTYRNAATLGGSIAARLADSELLAALLVLEASLTVYAPEAVVLSLPQFWALRQPSALITEIRIPWGAGRGASERVARTPADYPIVSVAAWQPEGETVRLAATGIDALPVRLPASEAAVATEGMERAAVLAGEECRHPGDFRGDASYRAQMAAVLTRRVLMQLLR